MKPMQYPDKRVDYKEFVAQMYRAGIMEEGEALNLASMPWSPAKIELVYQQVIVQLVNHIVEQGKPNADPPAGS